MYCSVNDVVDFTGIKAEDVGIAEAPEKFKAWVESLIAQADSMIDAHCRRSFDPEEADAKYRDLLAGISMKITANLIMKSLQLRTSPVEKIDDFVIRVADSSVITEDIKESLALLPIAPNIGIGIVGGIDDTC
jgi:hypothetical protein